MRPLKDEVLICLDCETTGLSPATDRIIEVAVVKFRGLEIIESFETLIDPGQPIPEASSEIHRIYDNMVTGKPNIASILPIVEAMVGDHPIVGHGIGFDLDILGYESERHQRTSLWNSRVVIDTVRLGRLYGESRANSLEQLRMHFNIAAQGAHRALSDVLVNIEVFHHLTKNFKGLQEIKAVLEKPIAMKHMPLGKHKGRPFQELPLDYLKWAARQDFDGDLSYSLRNELNRRKSGKGFYANSNPFNNFEL